MKKAFVPRSFNLLAGLILVAAIPMNATTYYVGVNGSHFTPATLTIEAGDTVVWENLDDIFSHTTTSDLPFFDPDYWNGVLVDTGDTFAHTFNNLGTFTYFDQTDTGTGSITVIQAVAAGITLDSPRIEGKQFLFDANGLTIGNTNILFSSTDLVSWSAISTNEAADISMTFTNAATLPRRFFRLLELPGGGVSLIGGGSGRR